jgi:hypothetical protein
VLDCLGRSQEPVRGHSDVGHRDCVQIPGLWRSYWRGFVQAGNPVNSTGIQCRDSADSLPQMRSSVSEVGAESEIDGRQFWGLGPLIAEGGEKLKAGRLTLAEHAAAS